ncbi:MAG: WG repeat-containing protein, partial [Bacteroidota bacterium]
NEYERISINFDSTLVLAKAGEGWLYNLKTRELSDSTFTRSATRRAKRPSPNTPLPMAKGVQREAPKATGTKIKLGRTPVTLTPKGWKLTAPKDDQQQLPDGIDYLHPKASYKMISGPSYQFWQGNKTGLLRADGSIAIPANYDELILARQYFDTRAIFTYARQGGKYGLIDRTGALITPIKYDEIRAFQEGMARVRIEDKWGFITLTGKESIPVVHDQVNPFSYGLTEVTLNGKSSFLDKDGICQLSCR